MCIECEYDKLTRRAFLSGMATAAAITTLSVPATAQQALDDPKVLHGPVTFASGDATINGYLARPKGAGRRRAIVILHGNAGLPADVREAAAQVARAGFVGLAVDSTSREPDISTITREFITSYRYLKRYMRDTEAGVAYLNAQPFVQSGPVGLIGFCGGGITGLMLAADSRAVAAVVALYAAPHFTPDRNSETDPRPDMITFVDRIRVPVQAHFGTEDGVIPMAHVREFERRLKARRAPSEVYVYRGAGHGFYNFASDAHHPAAARRTHSRMIGFLRRHLR